MYYKFMRSWTRLQVIGAKGRDKDYEPNYQFFRFTWIISFFLTIGELYQ